MSGDQVGAPVCRREELHLGNGQGGVVPAEVPAPGGALAHGVVAAHGVALAQGVLVRQLALLQRLDEDGRLLVQLSGAAARCHHLGANAPHLASRVSVTLALFARGN